MRKLLVIVLFVTAAVAVNAAFQAISPDAFGGPSASVEQNRDRVESQLQDLLHERLNQIRKDHRLPPLRQDSKLTQIARRHSRDMIQNGFFTHDNLRGESSSDRVANGHRRLVGLVGENLWAGSKYDFLDVSSLATRICSDLMKSKGHRENILNGDYTHLGIGVVMQGDEIRATQLFAAVEGLLRRELPEQVRRGQPLDLRMDATGHGPPVRFDFETANRKRALGPFPLEAAAAPSRPGQYRIRFYFPTEKRLVLKIVYGPAIEVR